MILRGRVEVEMLVGPKKEKRLGFLRESFL